MKRIIPYIAICLIFQGCTDDDYDGERYATLTPHYMKVSTKIIDLAAYNSSVHMQVSSIKTAWKIENTVDWLSFSPSSGKGVNDDYTETDVQINAQSNPSVTNSRIGVFNVKSDEANYQYSCPVTVTQSAATPYIYLEKSTIEFPGTANTATITVNSNCEWEASKYIIESTNPDYHWLQVTKNGNQLNIVTTPNTTGVERSNPIYLSYGNISATLTVKQLPAKIDASSEELVFDNTGGTISVNLKAESSWTASTSEDWINVEPENGDENISSITINVLPNGFLNEKTGNVFLIIGTKTCVQIPVRQKGNYIQPEQTEITFPSTANTQKLSIKSNINWNISTLSQWLTISTENGNGDAEIEITAADNPNTTDRVGTIYITNDNLGIEISVPVTQKGKSIDINTTVLNFEDKASIQPIEIETDGTWSATTSNDWITLTPASGKGNATLTVGVTENTSDNERTGQLTITMADQTTTVNIIQKGKFFTISDESLSYPSIGGAIDINITTNDTWTAKVVGNPAWLKLSNESGSGTIDLTATAADNPSSEPRTATIFFETKYSQSIKLIVTQAARYLNVDACEQQFYAKGGTSDIITISTDGKYSITCSDTWFSVSQTENTFTITAAKNTALTPRSGTVNIVLTALKEGSKSVTIDVFQYNAGSSFFKSGYGEETNYDVTITATGEMSKTGFATSDTGYDITITTSGDMSKTGYETDDTGYDVTTKSSGDLNKTGFEDDTNYD